MNTQTTAKPAWLKRSLPRGPEFERVRKLVQGAHLHTVCQEAKCPNIWHCFANHTATFMILGDLCTRNCRYCNVSHGKPLAPDATEPESVARAALALGLTYVVITSVTRDDLEDGGAAHFVRTIEALRETLPDLIGVEVLIPDFGGSESSLRTVMDARPEVLNHNIETVPSLYPTARPEAIYHRSLELLARAHQINPAIPVKSGLMVGLGETREELLETMKDLVAHGCSILTIGQYLQPSKAHLAVDRYYPPDEFDDLKELALGMGFKTVASGPFVRSSFEAQALFSHN
ncbi:LipA [Desulforapulum autotrophicum HRM2]|uniref:Lipoyl synthase n=1 Tax=Desulforapulum autotrophicum (strain ATCC 43914 / DSM 3382 / VKM B-1955 / HRM2) TaxID=177437 RepID=C0QGU0_DESAH|nr:lipoyl synthase [Desulforapulum autotrophicum]ACN15589.1 LipA [Desulforapulum autotrophicum HRM2]